MNLKFTNIVSEKATMLIYKHIGNDVELGRGIDGSDFANEVLWLNKNSDCNEIEVRINSIGGSVSDGLSICSAILNSDKPVSTVIDGMAYSMAGVIAMCGTKKRMVDFGTFMMHNAQGGSDEDVLNLITNSLAKIFERTTVLTLANCKDLMSKETWMSSDECLRMGLVDEIISTTNKKPIANTTVLELHNFYNKLINKPMIKVTNLLKLANEASEDAIVEAIEKIETEKTGIVSEIDALKNENKDLKEKLKSFEDSEAAKQATEKLEVIENAIKEKKIEATKKDYFVNSAMTSTYLKEMFEAIKIPYTPVFNSAESAAGAVGDRSKWTFRDWEKKDSAGLAELQNSAPEAFNELLKTIPTQIKSKY